MVLMFIQRSGVYTRSNGCFYDSPGREALSFPFHG